MISKRVSRKKSKRGLEARRKAGALRSRLAGVIERTGAEEALRNNEARLSAILETAVEGIITIDECGLLELFNPAAARMFGYTSAEVIGQNVSLLMPLPHREQHNVYIANYLATGERKIIGIGREIVGRRKDGSDFPLELSVSEVQLANRRIFTGILRDITERKRAEEALRCSEANLVHAQKVAHVGSYELNLPGTERLHWSAETFRILGLNPLDKELSFEDYLARVVHRDDRARVREGVERTLHQGTPYDIEYRIVRPDGSVHYVHSMAEPVMGPDKNVIKLVGSLQDVSERRELEKKILEISEREQNRIGQDLHDGLCQHLAGIEFRILSLKQKLEGKSRKQAAETTELAKLVRQGIDQARTLARGLSPVMLDTHGLMDALKDLAASTEKVFKISCSLNCPIPVLIRDNAVATHLYRIAQEAVHNAIRHGKAKSVVIYLLKQNHRIVLIVKDDGVGFPRKLRKHKGMGLRLMQYRARMVGGSLVVQHEPDGGTSIICSLRVGG